MTAKLLCGSILIFHNFASCSILGINQTAGTPTATGNEMWHRRTIHQRDAKSQSTPIPEAPTMTAPESFETILIKNINQKYMQLLLLLLLLPLLLFYLEKLEMPAKKANELASCPFGAAIDINAPMGRYPIDSMNGSMMACPRM